MRQKPFRPKMLWAADEFDTKSSGGSLDTNLSHGVHKRAFRGGEPPSVSEALQQKVRDVATSVRPAKTLPAAEGRPDMGRDSFFIVTHHQ